MALSPACRRHATRARRALVAAHGVDTLAPFALRADKSYFFSEDESAFLAYTVVGGVAIVAGDPIGPADAREALVRRFLEFAHERGWRLRCSACPRPAWSCIASLGLRALYHGDEAVVDALLLARGPGDPQGAAVGAPARARPATRRRVLRPSEIDAPLRAELEADRRAPGAATAPERGFVMALDALFGLGDDGALFFVGVDANGRPKGFLHFAIRTPAPRCRSRRCRGFRTSRTGSTSGSSAPRSSGRATMAMRACH